MPALAVTILSFWCATTSDVQDSATVFKNLASQDYGVKDGIMHFFKAQDCLDLMESVGSCYGNNPSSPYGFPLVPPPANQTEPLLDECGSKWNFICSQNAHGETSSSIFHLGRDEAVIILGISPPKVKYFAFNNYLYERTYSGVRHDIFASMGDALNLNNMHFVNASSPFNAAFAVVMSPAATTYSDVERLLKQSGYAAINPLPWPGAIMNLGFQQGADTAMVLMRMAFAEDPKANEQYINENPLVVLRLTPLKQRTTVHLYPRPPWCSFQDIPRKVEDYCLVPRSKVLAVDRLSKPGVTKERLESAQNLVLKKLKQSSKHGAFSAVHTPFTGVIPEDGFLCLDEKKTCYGDTRDTLYPVSLFATGLGAAFALLGLDSSRISARLGDSSGEAIVLVGVNHVELNISAYTSLTVQNYDDTKGVLSVPSHSFPTLIGSATRHLVDTEYEDLAPLLYAVSFTRGQCGNDSFCVDVPTDGLFSVPLETPLLLIERIYLDPLTNIGPDKDALIGPYLLKLSGEGGWWDAVLVAPITGFIILACCVVGTLCFLWRRSHEVKGDGLEEQILE
eukprot:TRINITY_DN49704_c0_g1_i1.p1 TRINITY_DN49704_c0_g1~~TRINITY_DN49704_c0_g1_i1.p1  ORF type:complete len:565 (-),score=48.37 TRINITY_DN49704_c0_g1_i1:71-1765(-)